MAIIQDILITILAGYMTIDQNGPVVLSWFSVIVGMISGLIMGDMNTGLVIGGTFQLMSLGVAALGGASHRTTDLQLSLEHLLQSVQERVQMQQLQLVFRLVFLQSSSKLLSVS